MARISLMLFIALGLSGCYDAPSDCSRLADLRIEAPGAGPTITHALTAFEEAVVAMTGQAPTGRGPTLTVNLNIDRITELGVDGFVFSDAQVPAELTAATEAGIANGLYTLLQAAGVIYLHPEQTHYPTGTVAMPTLPTGVQVPSFEVRGFHEHTQHPIIMSDYLLVPDIEGGRAAVSRYIKWLARTRQNALSFHGLNTIELEAWLPYMADIEAEGDEYGVDVGIFLSFADQQQHNFKLIETLEENEEAQIAESLDLIMAAGFDYIGFQIGTSEFTMPEEGSVVRWLNFAAAHLARHHPAVRPYTWVHITCDLHLEDGSNFFHQSLQADTGMGALVHTTMFYTLYDPAPVYGCQNFRHQIEYMEEANGQREMLFFPETAWWLGFDNTVPLLMPITGLSRERDIRRVLSDHDVRGHVTFTTGREWTYWQYDHYLTRSTWDGGLSWREYAQQIAPLYGSHGGAVATVLGAWADLQAEHIYDTNPEIYFYLSGELPQDEAGVRAGVVARQPKLALSSVLGYDDEAFGQWQSRDYAMLEAMRVAYAELLDQLPPTESVEGSALQRQLYGELRRTAELFVMRIDHALNIYGGVIAARAGDEEAATAALDGAREISTRVVAMVAEGEAGYRYPLELLAEEKPSLTAYPFGYLYETRTGFFWTRREDQLATLLDGVFNQAPEVWNREPANVLILAPENLELVEPVSPLANMLLSGFIPQLLFAFDAVEPESAITFQWAQDGNANGLPDPDSITEMSGDGDPWAAATESYALSIRGTEGDLIGDLSLVAPALSGEPRIVEGRVTDVGELSLTTGIRSADLIAMVRSIAGIDEEGLGNLIKAAFGIPAEDPLPDILDLVFNLILTPAE